MFVEPKISIYNVVTEAIADDITGGIGGSSNVEDPE